ncbi:uncharacterized protein DNG_04190 [Cephalotrichum gorgonifer]|uniref:Uncharacterized protein n=1 Tax=Cephalotrichum gorgonifer TaxID=2041049 RepID=A0AAE8MWI9_9PEZI|nr:uncharacterized protein DNG_04190 [Cephalotrichum gorgonifer]
MSLASLLLGQFPAGLNLMNGDTVSNLNFAAYDQYVQDQQKLFDTFCSLAIAPDMLATLGMVAHQIRHKTQCDEVLSYISASAGNGDRASFQATLNLVARLVSMVEIGSVETEFAFQHHASQRPLLQWTEGNLASLLGRIFSSSPQIDCSGMVAPLALDAWSLDKVAGIKVRFTNNLADHLRLANKDTLLYVFHHVAFLEHQKYSTVLPEGLAEETLKTLAILFPQSDYCGSLRSTRKKRVWLGRLRAHSIYTIDDRLTWCGTPNMDDRQPARFRFWRDRLVIIKEVYDESTPDSFSEWWHDRRNGVQWHNFWVAIVVLGLTALFGLIQCVLAAIQVHKAYHPSN